MLSKAWEWQCENQISCSFFEQKTSLGASYCFISFISSLLEGRLCRLIRSCFQKASWIWKKVFYYYYLVLLIKRTVPACAGRVRKAWPIWGLFKALTEWGVICSFPFGVTISGSKITLYIKTENQLHTLVFSVSAPHFEFNPGCWLKMLSLALFYSGSISPVFWFLLHCRNQKNLCPGRHRHPLIQSDIKMHPIWANLTASTAAVPLFWCLLPPNMPLEISV